MAYEKNQFSYYQNINLNGDAANVFNNRIFQIEVKRGNVSGFTHIHKFGNNATVGGSMETIWDGSSVYSYLSSASVLKLSSGSANDTSAGSGARTIHIFGLDSNYLEIEEVVTLNGQTSVNSVNSYLRIYRMIIITAGSGGKNAGIVYAGTGTVSVGVPANIFAQITIGFNQTLMAVYTIPAGKTGYLISKFANTNKDKEVDIHLLVRPLNEVFQVKEIDVLFQTLFFHENIYPLIYAEKTDIELQAKVVTGSANVGAGFDILLIDNNLTF